MSDERVLVIPRALDGARLDEALATLLDGPSKALLQKWVRRGALRVDAGSGTRVVRRSNVRVRAGESYRLRDPGSGAARGDLAAGGDRAARGRADDRPTWRLVHEDDAILVVDKAAGVLTHAAPRSNDESLCEAVVRELGPLPTTLGAERPGVVHRLDRWTSGLVVLGRTDDAMHALREAFARRRVRKEYLALVHGREVRAAFDCDEPIAPGRRDNDRQWVGERKDAKPAHTRFEPLEHLGACALLACRPTTGRRHQIRAHLWSAGLALLGETIYRVPRRDGAAVPRAPRQALHAAGLSFAHPTTGRELSFESPWPADLQPLLDGLRASAR